MSANPASMASTDVAAGTPAVRPESKDATSLIPRIVRALGLVGVLLSLVSASVTFFILTGLTRIAPSPEVVLSAMLVNGGLVALLLLVVAWEIGNLVIARRRGRSASRLHIRIVLLVSLLAAAPAVIMTITASTTLDRGLDNWFSVRTRAIVDNSLSIARAYAAQQAELLRANMQSAKAELERAGGAMLVESPNAFDAFFRTIAAEHRLAGAYLVNIGGALVRQTPFSTAVTPPSTLVLEQAGSQPDLVFIIPPGRDNLIGALTRLEGYDDIFLFGARPLSPETARYLAVTNASIVEYRGLEASRANLQIAFGILFLGITLVVVLSAIWLAIGFANRLVTPIRLLIDAANDVSQGNLETAVETRGSDGDVGTLGVTFNTMTAQLRSQRDELISTSEQMDSRRRFTEAVLSGVTTGVVGIDANGAVTIANRTALDYLGVNAQEAVGTVITELVPQLKQIVGAALQDGRPEQRGQFVITRQGRERTVNVRVTTERGRDAAHGYVITLDDITDLITAQRSSAWADVARRIAHEIKNPLTPIQLSAERLKRKFGNRIEEDRDIFVQCTDTIVRQVGDIGRMVDEFSSFARMPKPTFETGDITTTVREAVFLISVSKPEIDFEVQFPDEPLPSRFDNRLLGQALANVVKNAAEAIEAVSPEPARKGKVLVAARIEGPMIAVEVSDNGIGLPKKNRRQLLEPYTTTREKGTGLGLAIVTKIIEEHGGRIELLDAPAVAEGGQGAMVRVSLPHVPPASETPTGQADPHEEHTPA
ncbi:MAG: ATP-binding protein [Alphaproteobacteria bacterium]